jgi:hypothetical protein
MHDAEKRWPILQKKRKEPYHGVSAAMNITGTTVFVPVDITDDDWHVILADLAISCYQASGGQMSEA